MTINSLDKDMISLLRSDELTKWLLILFAANNEDPIKGKVMLTKMTFLLSYEIVPNLKVSLQFFPYQFGPYSTELAKRINRLLDASWLYSEKKGKQWEFRLSEEGRKEVERITDEMTISDELNEKIAKLKRSFSKKPLSEVLNEIYAAYPEFAIYGR